MPLPRYQPIKKKLKVVGPSFEDLDDHCLSQIIAHALDLSRSSSVEPYVKENGKTERNLSLVSRRWYFLTQTQISTHGVHRINIEEALKKTKKLTSCAARSINFGPPNNNITVAKTPRRFGLQTALSRPSAASGATSARKRLPYGVLSQRNMTVTTGPSNQQVHDECKQTYDFKLFRAINLKLLKYKHIQLTGSLTVDNFDKLLATLNSARVERVDLINLKIEDVRSYPLATSKLRTLNHIQTLTYTWTNHSNNEISNALLWTIFERAVNLRELQVYLIDDHLANGNNDGNKDDSQRSSDSTHSAPTASINAISDFNGKFALPLMSSHHPHLSRVIFERIVKSADPSIQYSAPFNCDYSILVKRVLAYESSILSLETNDSSLIEYLISSSSRVCTKHELRSLKLLHPIKSIELLKRLVNLANLGSRHLSIMVEDADQLGELKVALENFSANRKELASCRLNLYLKDEKFPDTDEKVKHLINLSRLVEVTVFISALQRISIDCCHLMWSTGRALQAIAAAGGADCSHPGKCIFKISLQTYPIRPNSVNPCEITVPFGRCPQYKISSTREDIVRHREIMKSLKRDCYHQFVKSVRDNHAP